jgi:hypothetical protein
MKKTATYYFIAQAALHALLGWALLHLNGMMVRTYAEHFEGRPLPAATTWAVSFHLWPYAVALLAAVGAVVAVAARDRLRLLPHVAFGIQLGSSFLMLISAIGYAVPFVSIVPVLGN